MVLHCIECVSHVLPIYIYRHEVGRILETISEMNPHFSDTVFDVFM